MLIRALKKRRERNSYKIKNRNVSERPILSVYKSNKNIYAQIVDLDGKVLVAFSSESKELKDGLKGKTGVEIAGIVGKGIAAKAIEAGIKDVAFNKGPYIYIGRIKALAEGAREAGLNF